MLADKVYEKLLPIYTNRLQELKDAGKNLSVFAPYIGEKFKPKESILFVGKATNNWANLNKMLGDYRGDYEKILGKLNEEVQSWVIKNWVNPKGHIKKSQFGRIIRGISSVFYQEDWHKYIAWTDLYKLSPPKGNPGAKLQRKQHLFALESFVTELAILRPKYVIMFTSGWENLFLVHLVTSYYQLEEKGDYSRFNIKSIKWTAKRKGELAQINVYDFSGDKFIVSVHPQGKMETNHISAILKVIDEIK